ncbi:MAG: dTDP-4-dehydrorhamnose reductase [Actinomycetota bacterium]|nr:dTDP-4-dehydrorhamnose reductase [Actinomycetota bacterium]
MTRRYLIAGARGMLGTAMQRVLTERDEWFLAPDESDFDITDDVRVRAVVADFVDATAGKPSVLVNAAAYTNVERAEDEPGLAYHVNEKGARNLALAAVEYGLDFVHVSTDYVFDGEKDGPYVEGDPVNPLSVYGMSKLAGERAVAEAYPGAIIARTAWVFGPSGVNFPVKMLQLARDHDTLPVVTDEVGSPTFTVDLATGLLGLLDAGATGLYHLTGSGSCSRFELAEEIFRLANIDVKLEPTTADQFPTKAHRPHNSMLDCSKAAALGVMMPDWRDALARFIPELLESQQDA